MLCWCPGWVYTQKNTCKKKTQFGLGKKKKSVLVATVTDGDGLTSHKNRRFWSPRKQPKQCLQVTLNIWVHISLSTANASSTNGVRGRFIEKENLPGPGMSPSHFNQSGWPTQNPMTHAHLKWFPRCLSVLPQTPNGISQDPPPPFPSGPQTAPAKLLCKKKKKKTPQPWITKLNPALMKYTSYTSRSCWPLNDSTGAAGV